MAFRMEQLQAQSQVLAPQLRQSLKILQASALELRSVIQEELQLNPTLEELPNESLSLDDRKPDEFDLSHEDYAPSTRLAQSQMTARHDFLIDSLTSEVSLQEHLLEQVGCLELPDKIKTIVSFIIGSLNEKGFLEVPQDEIMMQTRGNRAEISEALSIVQQLDPAGVGCKDVVSSLLVQLKHQNKEKSLATKILKNCYDLLLHNRIAEIARRLSVSKNEVLNAIKNDISRLDPAPGRRFQHKNSHGIIPDVRIYKNHLDEWCVELNNQHIPRLQIGALYKDLLSQNLKTEERNYLRLKIRSGRFLIQAILQRQKTVDQIAHALLRRQYLFFENGPDFLKPLTMQTLADDLGIHETTVSRATSNKYVETPHGLFSFKYFFTKGLISDEGECISNSIIKKQIKKIIEEEDKRKPFSDQRIVDLLAKDNVQVARRTVAKYREVLGIPATSLRRRYD